MPGRANRDLTRVFIDFHCSSLCQSPEHSRIDGLGSGSGSVLQPGSLQSERCVDRVVWENALTSKVLCPSAGAALKLSPLLCSCCHGHAWLCTSLTWTGPQISPWLPGLISWPCRSGSVQRSPVEPGCCNQIHLLFLLRYSATLRLLLFLLTFPYRAAMAHGQFMCHNFFLCH